MLKNGFFYGAGWNAEKNMERWRRQGYNPYCFIDADINKQHKKFTGGGEYEILSLDEAIEKYGEQTIFITLTEKYWPEVMNFLRGQGIDEKKIIPLERTILNPRSRADSHISTANDFLEFGKRSKHVLDLGCGDGLICRTIADYYNCITVGIDANCAKKTGENWSTMVMDARKLEFPDNSFDAIISIATLEHLSDLEKVFSEMYRVLKPNGRVYITGGPIWGCAWGHHYNHHIVYDPVYSILPKYCHLYMSKSEMMDFLTDKGFSEDTSSYVAEFIYDSAYLNRITATQIVEKILKSDFKISDIRQRYSNAYGNIPQDIKRKLDLKYSAADMDVSEMTVKLTK